MNKRTLLIGVLVAVVGLALWLLSPGFVPMPFEHSNFTIAGGAFHAMSFAIPANASVLLLEANLSAPVNVYGFAGGAAAAWEGGASASGLARAEALEGNGLIAAYTNVTEFVIDGSIPGAAFGTLVYNTTLPSGSPINYTLVFDNSYNATAPVSARVAYVGPVSASNLGNGSRVSNYIITIGAIEWVFLIMLIAGIGIAVWGAFRRPKGGQTAKAQQSEIEERDRLYKTMSQQGRRRGRK